MSTPGAPPDEVDFASADERLNALLGQPSPAPYQSPIKGMPITPPPGSFPPAPFETMVAGMPVTPPVGAFPTAPPQAPPMASLGPSWESLIPGLSELDTSAPAEDSAWGPGSDELASAQERLDALQPPGPYQSPVVGLPTMPPVGTLPAAPYSSPVVGMPTMPPAGSFPAAPAQTASLAPEQRIDQAFADVGLEPADAGLGINTDVATGPLIPGSTAWQQPDLIAGPAVPALLSIASPVPGGESMLDSPEASPSSLPSMPASSVGAPPSLSVGAQPASAPVSPPSPAASLSVSTAPPSLKITAPPSYDPLSSITVPAMAPAPSQKIAAPPSTAAATAAQTLTSQSAVQPPSVAPPAVPAVGAPPATEMQETFDAPLSIGSPEDAERVGFGSLDAKPDPAHGLKSPPSLTDLKSGVIGGIFGGPIGAGVSILGNRLVGSVKNLFGTPQTSAPTASSSMFGMAPASSYSVALTNTPGVYSVSDSSGNVVNHVDVSGDFADIQTQVGGSQALAAAGAKSLADSGLHDASQEAMDAMNAGYGGLY
jgi:hypothetical protein